MIDIKPCPFCKFEKPAIIYKSYKSITGTTIESAWVICPACDAEGPHESLMVGVTIQEAAIQAWNER